ILVAIASHFILGEAISRRTFAGAITGVIGTAVICKDGLAGVRLALVGDGVALLGALAFVGYLLVGSRIRSRLSLLAYATPVYAACSMFLLVWAGGSGLPIWHYGTMEWVYFIALAVIPTILGHTVLNWAIKHVPATGISIAFLGEPVVAAGLAFLFLSQKPPMATLAG